MPKKEKQAANSIPKGKKTATPSKSTFKPDLPVMKDIPSGPIADIPGGVPTHSMGAAAGGGPVRSTEVATGYNQPRPRQHRPGGPMTPSQHLGARPGSSIAEAQKPIIERQRIKNERMEASLQGINNQARRPDLEAKYPKLRWHGYHYMYPDKDEQFFEYLADIGQDIYGQRLTTQDVFGNEIRVEAN